MKRFLFPLIIVFLTAGLMPLQAQEADLTDLQAAQQLFQDAHVAFEKGEMDEAQQAYEKLAFTGWSDARVWANAGAAAYRSGDVGRAVLYYHRALRDEPSYERAQQSLALISPATNDVERNFAGEFLNTLFQTTSPALWVIFAEFAFLFACVGIAMVMRSVDPERRGHWVAVTAWSGVFCLVLAVVAFANHRTRYNPDEAVVIEDRAITYSEPREDAKAVLELPAGTLVDMVESPRRGFVRIKMADGTSGYLPTSDIEKI